MIFKGKILWETEFVAFVDVVTKRIRFLDAVGKDKSIGSGCARKKDGKDEGRECARYLEITRDETFIKHTAHDSFVDFQQSGLWENLKAAGARIGR